MNVAQETLGFRRAGLSPALSLLMSAFALPIPPAEFSLHLHRPTERSPTIQASEFRGQKSEIAALFPTSDDALQHLGYCLVLIAPTMPRCFIDVSQVITESAPDPHLVGRTHADLNKAFELRYRVTLLGIAFCQIHTNGFAGATHLIRQRI